MAAPAWLEWRDRLAQELATLAESEVLTLEYLFPPSQQRRTKARRILFWTVPSRPVSSGFLVQFVGQGQEVLMATCAGPESLGGPLPLTEEQDRRIRELGWKGLGDEGHWDPYGADYTVQNWPQSDALRLAQLAVDALEVQGATPDLDWEIRRFN